MARAVEPWVRSGGRRPPHSHIRPQGQGQAAGIFSSVLWEPSRLVSGVLYCQNLPLALTEDWLLVLEQKQADPDRQEAVRPTGPKPSIPLESHSWVAGAHAGSHQDLVPFWWHFRASALGHKSSLKPSLPGLCTALPKEKHVSDAPGAENPTGTAKRDFWKMLWPLCFSFKCR